MYLDTATIKQNGKIYKRHLLRSSYRENGKVKHKTIANLSGCSQEEIEAIRLALKHKDDLRAVASIAEVQIAQGKRIGAAWCVYQLAKQLQIAEVLGNDRQGKLALWQVMARLIDQGSRLSAVRLAASHMGCELLGIDHLDEDDLYGNLHWLADNQERLEKELFVRRYSDAGCPSLFLYDVTSAYLEGTHNALGAFGYDRDKKRGKMQIVIGLLTDPEGEPAAVRVFEGNTPDGNTVAEQVRILADSFGVKHITLVGDRGMLKGPQIEALPEDFCYLTAITKPQIRKLLQEGTLQYELFSERLCEVEQESVRYVLRRNPLRAQELGQSRQDKLRVIEHFTAEVNGYLAEHKRASEHKALSRVQGKIRKLKSDVYCAAVATDRRIVTQTDPEALREAALLDGCYVLKSDVPKAEADADKLHERYLDLAEVERGFRTMKTAHLEVRPVYVHTEPSTRGHVFVVMLAYLIERQLDRAWRGLDLTVQEGLDELGAMRVQKLTIGGASLSRVPDPDARCAQLLEAAGVTLPSVLGSPPVRVATKKKLQSERIKK
jgi:hypothetical protein